MTKTETSAKMSEIKPCLCRNGIFGRGSSRDLKTDEVVMFLHCMMCGRKSEGKTPRDVVDTWNKENGEDL